MIRQATPDDLETVVRLASEFHAYSPWKAVEFDPVGFGEFAARLIEHGGVFLSDDGVIAGVLIPLPFNPSVVMGTELFWWARAEGKALREAFEAWARERGAAGVQCSGLVDHREQAIRKVYARAGYFPAEMAFVKRF